jgi:hypothetical protein
LAHKVNGGTREGDLVLHRILASAGADWRDTSGCWLPFHWTCTGTPEKGTLEIKAVPPPCSQCSMLPGMRGFVDAWIRGCVILYLHQRAWLWLIQEAAELRGLGWSLHLQSCLHELFGTGVVFGRSTVRSQESQDVSCRPPGFGRFATNKDEASIHHCRFLRLFTSSG